MIKKLAVFLFLALLFLNGCKSDDSKSSVSFSNNKTDKTETNTSLIQKPQNIKVSIKNSSIIYKDSSGNSIAKEELQYDSIYNNQISVIYKGDVDGVEFVADFDNGLKSGFFTSKANNEKEFLEDLQNLLDNPNVIMAEPNYEVKIDADSIVNDEYYPSMANLKIINIDKAWEISFGDEETVVAVIDTGVDYTHGDLSANMWKNSDEIASNGIDDDQNGIIDDVRGVDFYNFDTNPMDDHFHGTHVAGIVAAVANNGIGIAGIAPKVKIMPIKVLSSHGSGNTLGIFYGFKYAVENGANVINASFGGSGFSYLMYYGAYYAKINHVLIVAAAGNSANNNDQHKIYPCSFSFDNIICVASSNQNNELSYFSNYGVNSVDIAAPGENILSTMPADSYGSLSGTSMATPEVTGTAALVFSMKDNLLDTTVKEYILKYAQKEDSLKNKVLTQGVLNVGEILNDPALKQTLKVVDTTPKNQATAKIDTTIKVNFNYPLECNTTLEDFFYLSKDDSSKVKGTLLCNNNIIEFIPDNNLSENSQYSIFVKKGLKSSKKKVFATQDNYESNFTTGHIATQPNTDEGEATYPVDGDQNIPLGVVLRISLDEELSVEEIVAIKFSLKDSKGNQISGKKAVYSDRITFTPTTLLEPNTTYIASFELPTRNLSYSITFKTLKK